MNFASVLLIAGAVFGILFGLDKLFTALFRSKAQHRSGMAVRCSKTYGFFGLVLSVLGILGVITGAGSNVLLLILGALVLLMGLALGFYYLGFGIFYDGETFLFSRPGKPSLTYAYRQILGQRLYLVQGGSLIIELHMDDGNVVSLQSTMEGVTVFLDTAFAGWCMQKGLTPSDCDFYDPGQSLWFPTMEET